MKVFLVVCAIQTLNEFVYGASTRIGDLGDHGGSLQNSLPSLLNALEINNTQGQEDERWIAVQRMGIIEDEIDRRKELGDKQSIEELAHAFEVMVWPRILEKSIEIYKNIHDWSNKVAEEEYQQELVKSVNRIRYKAGDRKCLATDEAFYPAMGKCYKFGRQQPENNPCPSKSDNVLYEGVDNTAVCDCVEDERNLVFYPENGQCFPLFKQGPCEENEWLVFQKGIPICRKVPLNCMADGKHAFGNPSGRSNFSEMLDVESQRTVSEGIRCWNWRRWKSHLHYRFERRKP